MIRLFVGSVVIPFLFVIVMSGVEYLAKPRLLWELMTDVAWDLCILGIGVTGGLFSAPEMEKAGDQKAHYSLLSSSSLSTWWPASASRS
jgi:hypothetical protein